ncbi:lysosomal-associated transmembrane protein [Nesidiocoris tenuis]|uniref:Lysosomal-associated transmembrane protein n=1 Tax=Nesidiocoris tenuis TaxID=355587 RepID=A0ABN7AU45_9HEMI|nr:lysosomal-associated transmembrane protein [Nesidiocoris tenuis]
MQGLSFKIGERENWRCGLCCHVRTATIFLGVWHLMLHIMKLSVIAVALRHPELMTSRVTQAEDPFTHVGVNRPGPPMLPTAQTVSEGFGVATDYSNNPSPNKSYDTIEHLNVTVVVMFSTFAITLMMIYGAIKGKPSYLMPFFCLQLFDFCIACLTAMTSLCYLPDMHRLINESPQVPMHAALLKLSPQVLAFVVLLTFTTAMVIKAYFINVVWSCYRYLTFRMIAASRTVHLIPESPPPDLQDLLPDYETACANKNTVQQPQLHHQSTPPPSYSQAVASSAAPPLPLAPPASSIPPPQVRT